jgi:phosphohistidine phosphatase
MLRLTLVRHAKTEPAHAGQSDWDRALEPQGTRDAPEMARRLRERGLKPDRILTSPARRARSTTALFAEVLGIPESKVITDDRLYLASVRQLLATIQELGGTARHLMVVGHNPGLTEFADEVSGERSLDNMPTCAVYTLEFDIKNWSELELAQGVNAEFDYPSKCY